MKQRKLKFEKGFNFANPLNEIEEETSFVKESKLQIRFKFYQVDEEE